MFPEDTTCLGFFKDFNYLFLERGEGREWERERESIDVWETHQSGASHRGPDQAPNPPPRHVFWQEIEQTNDLSICRMMPNQLSHTSKGWVLFFHSVCHSVNSPLYWWIQSIYIYDVWGFPIAILSFLF